MSTSMEILVLLEAMTFLDSRATVNCEEQLKFMEFDRLVSLKVIVMLFKPWYNVIHI